MRVTERERRVKREKERDIGFDKNIEKVKLFCLIYFFFYFYVC